MEIEDPARSNVSFRPQTTAPNEGHRRHQRREKTDSEIDRASLATRNPPRCDVGIIVIALYRLRMECGRLSAHGRRYGGSANDANGAALSYVTNHNDSEAMLESASE